VRLWWEGCSKTRRRSFSPPMNSLFTAPIHDRDDLGYRLAPFKTTTPTRACNSCSCGHHFSSLRRSRGGTMVHSLRLPMIFLLRVLPGLRVGLGVFSNLARLLTGLQRTKGAESPYHC
jgi:hypothetical protein